MIDKRLRKFLGVTGREHLYITEDNTALSQITDSLFKISQTVNLILDHLNLVVVKSKTILKEKEKKGD